MLRNLYACAVVSALMLAALTGCNAQQRAAWLGTPDKPGKLERGAEKTRDAATAAGNTLVAAFPAAAVVCYGIAAAAGGAAALLKLRRQSAAGSPITATAPATAAAAMRARAGALRLSPAADQAAAVEPLQKRKVA